MTDDVPAEGLPEPGPLGDCFSAAGKFISRWNVLQYPKDYWLVHGKLSRLRQDVTSNHAWAEEGDFVHEVSNGRADHVQKDVYYKAMGVTSVRKYKPEEAIGLMIRHGHWGPWE
jgi:hypothetical protein